MRLRQVALILLLLSGSTTLLAEPSGYARNRQAGTRAIFLEAQVSNPDWSGQRSGPKDLQPDPRRVPAFAFPETSTFNARADGADNTIENARRPGRLSAEERRALRRQIDEVGHDIYAPNR